ncbi:hypothetical protein XENORESO_003227 [Xenotaenia resolanae]|uniref:Uncharacterized protein n=1 Tax=Xenotaenia resolanae TaxID=208358 RepID=A0ABV0WKH4_9TELE
MSSKSLAFLGRRRAHTEQHSRDDAFSDSLSSIDGQELSVIFRSLTTMSSCALQRAAEKCTKNWQRFPDGVTNTSLRVAIVYFVRFHAGCPENISLVTRC